MSKKAEMPFPVKIKAFIAEEAVNTKKTIVTIICDMAIWLLCGIGVFLSADTGMISGDGTSPYTLGGLSGLLFTIPALVWCDIPLVKAKKRNIALLRLLAVSAIAVFLVFINQHSITQIIFNIYSDSFEILKIPDISSFFVGFTFGFLLAAILFYIEIVLKSASLCIILTFTMLIQTTVTCYNTNSIPNLFGIYILIIAWIAIIVYQNSGISTVLYYTIIGVVTASVIGITAVFGFGMEEPVFIRYAADFIHGDMEFYDNNDRRNIGFQVPRIVNIFENSKKTESVYFFPTDRSELAADGRFRYSNEVVLRAEMDFETYGGSAVYLRHFFGANYANEAWLELSETQKNAESAVIGAFRTPLLTPYNFDTFSYRDIQNAEASTARVSAFDIENVAILTEKPFLPYFLSADTDFFTADKTAFSDVGSDYSGTSVMPNGFLNNSDVLTAVLSGERTDPNPDFVLDERHYRAFVYNNYLDVSDEFLSENPVLGQDYIDYITSEAAVTGKSTLTNSVVYARKLQYIKSWLRDNCEYDINSSQTPPGTDFALYFLNESKTGFCQHFATAGTLLCRAAGIPARYVTGFIISQSDYAAGGTVDVTESRAHAWTEVYADGFGWMPMDFTSGYGNVRTSLTASERERREQAENQQEAAENAVPKPVETTATTVNTESPGSSDVKTPENPAVNDRAVIDEIPGMTANPVKSGISPITAVLITAIISIVAALCIILLRHHIKKRRYAKILSTDRAFDSILTRLGVVLSRENLSTDTALNDIEAYYQKLADSDYGAVTPVIKMAVNYRFGVFTPQKSDIETAESTLKTATMQYLRKQKPVKRLFLIYFLNIM
jgi:transglutaminase-like putative cysteine protease